MPNIDETATIIECEIAESAKVYRFANLKKTMMEDGAIIADFCKVENTKMGIQTHIYAHGIVYSSIFGDYSYVQKNSSIWYAQIGKYCSLSWNVSIGGGEHDFHRVTTHSLLYAPSYGFIEKPAYDRLGKKCEIGNDVWVGAGAQILRGVTVGDGAVIGAGAIVTHDVEPYSIVAGVPAKKIGQRCSDELIAELIKIKWWDINPEILKMHSDLLARELDQDTVSKLKEIGAG